MKFLERNNVKIRYKTLGDESAETIFLLNGGFMRLENWGEIASQLSKDYHVVLHDSRCQGASTCPKELRLEDNVGDIVALMDKLPVEKAHVIGISYGGIISQLLALEHPDRIKTLTLIATTSESPVDAHYRTLRWKEAAESGDARNFVLSWITDIYSSEYLRENPEIIEVTIEKFDQLGYDCQAMAKILGSLLVLKDEPLKPKIKDIKIPTLTISGSESITKEFTEDIHEQIEDSIHIEIPGAGHAISAEKPNELITAIRGFLEDY